LAIPAAAVDDTVSVSDESIELYPKFDDVAAGGGGGRGRELLATLDETAATY
jgi:hypothetical protein